MNAVDPRRGHGWWLRAAAFLGLVGVAAVLLPLSALVVEAASPRAENWILPVHLVAMGLVGAAVGALVHRIGPGVGSTARTVLVWAAVGLFAAAMSDAVWWTLLAG